MEIQDQSLSREMAKGARCIITLSFSEAVHSAVNEIEQATHPSYFDAEDPVVRAPASLFHIICEDPTDSDIQATNATTEQAMSVFINPITCHSETVSIDQVKQAASTDKQYLCWS